MPRLLFGLFVSVLKMGVLPLNSLSANVIFYMLGGGDVGADKTREHRKKKKPKDKTERRDTRQADGI